MYSRSALTVWRAVPLCCNAILAQRMRAQRARHTAACAKYHTLTCPHSSARPSRLVGHRFGDADDETSHQRGVWDVPADYVKVAFNVPSLERPQRPPPCERCSSPSRECSSPSRRNYEITSKKPRCTLTVLYTVTRSAHRSARAESLLKVPGTLHYRFYRVTTGLCDVM